MRGRSYTINSAFLLNKLEIWHGVWKYFCSFEVNNRIFPTFVVECDF